VALSLALTSSRDENTRGSCARGPKFEVASVKNVTPNEISVKFGGIPAG
jgi:hypothetical protein